MNSTDANTIALNLNTQWVIISVIIAVILFILGIIYKKSQGKNIVKNTINRGKISQTGGDNLVDDVDNYEPITQKK